jgi:DNA polymerase-3 subunit gamma/tau
MHLDIIEIDAASNRRIDEIRDLRDRVHIAPTSASYKVYIIDEVHMLTKEAFNALLKTLEEPPAHVIFVLATTEAHKLPETIISRTQRFSFKSVSRTEIAKHLEDIAKKEKFKISLDALGLIAEHSDGSVRDSISLLDQLAASDKEITQDEVRNILGIPKAESIDKIIDSIRDAQGGKVVKILEKLWEQGINPAARRLGRI